MTGWHDTRNVHRAVWLAFTAGALVAMLATTLVARAAAPDPSGCVAVDTHLAGPDTVTVTVECPATP